MPPIWGGIDIPGSEGESSEPHENWQVKEYRALSVLSNR